MDEEQEDRIFLIIRENVAYYSFIPADDIDCWGVSIDLALPWLVDFPQLLEPQTIH